MSRINWAVIAAVNDEIVLKNNLLRSPDIGSASQVILKRGFDSAAKAYNSALMEAKCDILVFAHQDVYFPSQWISRLETWIHKLNSIDPNWASSVS